MHPYYRDQYNRNLTPQKYERHQSYVHTMYGHPSAFRLAETPIFLPTALRQKLVEASRDIIQQLRQPHIKPLTDRAIPPEVYVPNETDHSLFLQLDFGITKNETGELMPQLIEMQGFPSLFFFQHGLAESFQLNTDVPQELTPFFNGLDGNSYVDTLRQAILGNYTPQEVVLLEIEPHLQPTAIDFYGTQHHLDIPIVCLSDVIKDDNKLYYRTENGALQRIHRIYNRVIFDELIQREDFKPGFDLTKPVEVEWAGHPNYFLRYSKLVLPYLDSPYVPHTMFLDDVDLDTLDLTNYILKPLFSFSGSGIEFDLDQEKLRQIPHKDQYILQQKVTYEPVIKTTHGHGDGVKVEIRMMFLWPDNAKDPFLINNLVRLSRGQMVGVKYNKDKDWVGASVAFFEKE